MKKLLALLSTLVLAAVCAITASAMQIDPGQQLEVELTVTSENAALAVIEPGYDRSVFEFISAGGGTRSPICADGAFVAGNALEPFEAVTITLTLRVSEDADPGDYTFTCCVKEAYNTSLASAEAVSSAEVITVNCTHRTKEPYPGVIPTTEMAGCSKGLKCTVCGELLESTEIPALTVADKLILPSSLLAVSGQSLANTAAAYVVINSGCERIESLAFAGNTLLSVIVIPESVTYIAEDAFSGTNCIVICAVGDSCAERYADAHGMPSIIIPGDNT